jgi:hypothetical protein
MVGMILLLEVIRSVTTNSKAALKLGCARLQGAKMVGPLNSIRASKNLVNPKLKKIVCLTDYCIECYERHSTILTMADKDSSAAPSKPDGGNESRGQKRAHSPESYDRNVRGRGRGRGRGDGGRGRGRGRGGQSRGRGGREDGYGSKKTGGRYKKGDMGRQEYRSVNLAPSIFTRLTKQVAII